MHIHIDLGAIFSWLFRRRKKDKVEHTVIEGNDVSSTPAEQVAGNTQEVAKERPVVTAADALDFYEQIGAFEELNVQDEALKQKLCNDLAAIMNEMEQTEQAAQDAFIRVLNQNGLNANLRLANMFASSYMESYVYNEE